MKQTRFLFVCLLAALLAPVSAWADSFEVDGIYYQTISDTEVEVVKPSGDVKYEGDITVPGGVIYNGQYYYVTAVGQNAFQGCSATSITLPAVTVSTLKNYSFNDVKLTSFTVPVSVTKIESKAFLYCDKITDFYFYSTTPPEVSSNSFSGMKKSSCVLHVPTGYKAAYQAVAEFAAFTNIEEWDLPEVYGLQVAGYPVSAINEDVFGDGSVVFDPATTTLTINRDIVSPDKNTRVIYNSGVEGLTLELNGTLTSEDAFCIDVRKETAMTGFAAIASNGNSAIYAWAPLTIIDADLDISGTIQGGNLYNLEIKNSNLMCNVSSGTVITGFHDVVLTDCFYRQPTEAVYANGALKEGALDVSSLQIEAGAPVSYDLWIDGTRVTELNCENIIGGGEASYDPGSKTLTIIDDISTTVDYVIDSKISNLNICVLSDVTLSSTYSSVLNLCENAVITGSGTLTLADPIDNYCIDVWKNLLIKDTTVKLENCQKGIRGVTSAANPTLTFENANVQGATLSGDPIIKDFTEVTLKDCYYEEPVGAKYENKQLVDQDGNGASTVKIVAGKEKKYVGLGFTRDVYIATVGKAFTAPNLNNESGVGVAYASSNTNVATVDPATGEVIIKGKGVTIISATYPGDSDYYPAKASYYLVVSKQEGSQYDTNMDGEVTIADAVTVVNAILNGAQ